MLIQFSWSLIHAAMARGSVRSLGAREGAKERGGGRGGGNVSSRALVDPLGFKQRATSGQMTTRQRRVSQEEKEGQEGQSKREDGEGERDRSMLEALEQATTLPQSDSRASL